LPPSQIHQFNSVNQMRATWGVHKERDVDTEFNRHNLEKAMKLVALQKRIKHLMVVVRKFDIIPSARLGRSLRHF